MFPLRGKCVRGFGGRSANPTGCRTPPVFQFHFADRCECDKVAVVKRRYLAIAAGGIIVLLLVVVAASRNSEPRYKNHSLSYWLDRLAYTDTEDEAQEAIRAIGTNAYPFLIKRLLAKDTKLERFLHRKAPSIWWRNSTGAKYSQAAVAFGVLGSQMKPWVPELIQWLTNGVSGTDAALAQLGETALPEVTSTLTNENWRLRAAAAGCLMIFQCDTHSTIPALAHALNDPNQDVAEAAAGSLAFKHPDSEVLRSLVTNPDPSRNYLRLAAISCLGVRGTNSLAARDALLKAKESDDADVSASATWALGQIGGQPTQ